MSLEGKLRMSAALERGLTAMCKEYTKHVVTQLSREYNFDAEAALESLNTSGLVFEKPSKSSKVRVAKEKRKVPSVVLPYCGQNIYWCNGLKMNHGLFTQCTNEQEAGVTNGYCKTCAKQCEKNANGKPTYGDIEDRVAVPLMEYRDPKGRQVVSYGNVMAKLNISRESAEAEASKFDWTIPEEQYAVKKAQRGRPKTIKADVSDTDSDEEKPKKKRGRPSKNKKVVSSANTGDDLIAALVAQATADSDSSDDELAAPENNIAEEAVIAHNKEVAKKEAAAQVKADKLAKKEAAAQAKADKLAQKEALKAEKEAAKADKLAQKEAAAAKKEAAKAQKEADKLAKQEAAAAKKAAKEAAKLEKEAKKAEKEAKKAEKEAAKLAKQAKKPEKEAAPLPVGWTQAPQVTGVVLEGFMDGTFGETADEMKQAVEEQAEKQLAELVEEEAEYDSGSDEEEEVVKFEHKGKTYLKSASNILYDPDTQEPLGEWDEANQAIIEYED